MEESAVTTNQRRKKKALAIFAAVLVASAVAGGFYLWYSRTHISTDDAFVEGNITIVAPRVSGTVKTLLVDDNQHVKAGDLLVEIDPADYRVRLNEAASDANSEKAKIGEADARVEAAKRMLAEAQARVASAKANLELQQANMKQAELDAKRADALFAKEVIPQERYEKMKTAYDVARAQVSAATEQLRQAEMAVETQQAVIVQAEAQKNSQASKAKQKEAAAGIAELNYGYTKIFAPVDGYITRKSVEIGNQVQVGQPLMAIVPLQDVYIVANYKETQIHGIMPGQRVKIKADAYPGRVFWGKVESIMAGTGSAFSLFPPENATGNYVKVVQRIPVKIVLEKGTDPDRMLRVGMSVVPVVYAK